jgi:formate dehydrogenase gamma subunit
LFGVPRNRDLNSSRWPFLFLIFFAIAFSPPGAGQNKSSTLPKGDETCLTCHGQPGMKSPSGKSVTIDPAKHAASAHGILGCRDCHSTISEYPHPAKIVKVECATCHVDEASSVPTSIHGTVLGTGACQSCHGDPHDVKLAADLAPTKCSECHSQEVKDFATSIHGRAASSGDRDAPKCVSCHGPVHKIQMSSDPASPVAKKNLPDTCATCHSNAEFLSRHNIPFAHPVELYKLSVHGRAVAGGNNEAATCSDCHGSHGIVPARDPSSKINHWNVASTCGACHSEITKTYLESIHGQAMKAGATDAPVCTDCHGEHLILGPKEAESTVNASRVSSATCGRCHGDERLAVRYNLPSDRVPSYADSFHGLALREGSQTVANCASCHGVHNIFPSSDRRSTVNPANLRNTCGACHAGAGENFAIGPVHVQASNGTAHPVVQWIRRIYWILIPLTLGFMVLHNLIDLLSKLIRRRPRHETGRQLERMNLFFRIAHWGVMVSFPTLVFTGFALKFPDAWWSVPLSHWRGHFDFRGDLHRIAAVLLLASVVYHAIHLSVNRRDRAFLKAMLPKWKDITDMLHVFAFNLGITKKEPKFGKFNYAEKLEYVAFIWGTIVMAISGFLLWFNNFTLRHFPKWVADAATAVHYYEALLATFSILLWHFYIVIFDPVVYPMDPAWLTGKTSADHYRHSRPEYFRALEKAALVDAPESDQKASSENKSGTESGTAQEIDPS